MQRSPRFAVLLRSPKVAWHRIQWSGPAQILTKWQLSSYKADLVPSPGNRVFGKPSLTSPSDGGDTGSDQVRNSTPNDDLTEEEECKVQ